jgi:hypothetical protein
MRKKIVFIEIVKAMNQSYWFEGYFRTAAFLQKLAVGFF